MALAPRERRGEVSRVGMVIAVAVRKGGAGKTTTVCNLGVAVARRTGEPVLLIDMDPQANLTKHLGVDWRRLEKTVNQVLFGDASADEVIVAMPWGVDLLPAGIDLAAAEKVLLGDPIDPNGRLREVTEPLRERYGYIFIDCPPALGVLTLNGLTAADRVVVPFEANALGAEGVIETLNMIGRVKKHLNPGLRVAGILANRFDGRLGLDREVLEAARERFGSQVFRTVVREAVSLQEAVGHGRPAAHYRSRNPGHRAALDAYDALAEELLTECGRWVDDGQGAER